MADQPPYPGAPRWVKFSVVAVIVLILLIAAALFIGGGSHGPGRHFALSGTAERGPQQP